MADVKVNEGEGPRIDTVEVVGEDAVTRHQQVVQIATGKVELDQAKSHYVTPSVAQHVSGGRAWIVSGKQTVALGNTATFSLDNPSTSTKNIVVFRAVIASTENGDAGFLYNPTIDTVNAIEINAFNPNTYYEAAGAQPEANGYRGENVTTGGTEIAVIRLFGNAAHAIESSFIVRPGDRLAVRHTPTASGTFYASVYWYEVTA